MSRVISPLFLGSDAVKRQKAYTKDDLIKTRFLFRTLFLVAFVAVLSLFYIWSRVQIVHYGYEINHLKEKQKQLIEENKNIKLEVATLKAPQRIEAVARDKLKMQAVQPEQIRVIEYTTMDY